MIASVPSVRAPVKRPSMGTCKTRERGGSEGETSPPDRRHPGLGKTTTCNMLFEQWQQPGHHASSGAKSLLASSRPKLMKSTRHVDVSRCFLRGVEGGASLARLQHARDDHLEGGAKEPQFLGEEGSARRQAREADGRFDDLAELRLDPGASNGTTRRRTRSCGCG